MLLRHAAEREAADARRRLVRSQARGRPRNGARRLRPLGRPRPRRRRPARRARRPGRDRLQGVHVPHRNRRLRAADDETLLDGMARAARLGLPVAVHAENDAVTQELAARARAEGRHALSDYLASRPVAAELEAVGRAIAIAEETGCSLHVVHASRPRGAARRRGAGPRRRRHLRDVPALPPAHRRGRGADRDGREVLAAAPAARRGRGALGGAARGHVPIVASDHSPARRS